MGSEKKEKTTSDTVVFNTLYGAAGRALLATPFDNFAKRTQIYAGPIKWQTIPLLFFQNGLSKSDKFLNAYRGILFGFAYKGLQIVSFDKSFEAQKRIEEKMGSGLLPSLASAGIVASVQTLALQPMSTIRVRIQVNKQAFSQAAPLIQPSSTTPVSKKHPLINALSQGNFMRGSIAALMRNFAFLGTSNVVITPYRQLIFTNQILASGDKLNEKQENLARTLSGSTAVFASVLFDNVKTQMQVNGQSENKANILSEVCHAIKTKGFSSGRAAIPYAIAEGLGLFGFYAAQRVMKAPPKETSEPKPQKVI